MLGMELAEPAALRDDFMRARNRTIRQRIVGLFLRKRTNLLTYATVHQLFGFAGMVDGGRQEIPVQAIVGSVGRATDFSPDFRPKKVASMERWMGIKHAFMMMRPVPPIEVYQVADVYFTIDGNHRVSVAREMDIDYIAALVTKVETERLFDLAVMAQADSPALLQHAAQRMAEQIDGALNRLGAQLIRWGRRLQTLGDTSHLDANSLDASSFGVPG